MIVLIVLFFGVLAVGEEASPGDSMIDHVRALDRQLNHGGVLSSADFAPVVPSCILNPSQKSLSRGSKPNAVKL